LAGSAHASFLEVKTMMENHGNAPLTAAARM
jgi:hypothetical protein